MNIVCKCERCGFWGDGFCTKRSTVIDANGMCGHIWKNGNIRPDAWSLMPAYTKEKGETANGEYRQVEQE